MTAPNVYPFPNSARTPAETRQAPRCARNVPGCDQPTSGDTPFPADLEALAASHADDLRRGSSLDALIDVFEAAKDARNNRPHVPDGVIAAAVAELLAPVLVEMGEIIARMARREALREAEELDRQLADMGADDQIETWRFLTPAQRSAVIHVQQQAMTGGVS